MKYLLLVGLLTAAANADQQRDINEKLERANSTLDQMQFEQQVAADAETSCQADLRFARWQVRAFKRLAKTQGWKITAPMMVQAMSETRE